MPGPGVLSIGLVGAGVMARAHSMALRNIELLYPDAALRPRLVAVADINRTLAEDLKTRFGFERAESDWRRVVAAQDIDLVCTCLPTTLNHPVVLAAAAAGKHVVCEKPLAESAAAAAELLSACTSAGVFHGLGAEYRWSSALRAIRAEIDQGALGAIRHLRASFLMDYGADPDVPLLWRFRRSLAGGGLAIDTGYHLVDCARFLAGDITTVQAVTQTFITQRRLPGRDAIGNAGAVTGSSSPMDLGAVDVEDAAAAIVTFADGGYGTLETSRVAIGKRLSLRIEIFGSLGSAEWDLERPDEFRLCLADTEPRFGFRRVLINPSHPGAFDLLVAAADGTSIGWLGHEAAMWREFLGAIAEGRPAHADFHDGVQANAVIDALYTAATSGRRVSIAVPETVTPHPRRN